MSIGTATSLPNLKSVFNLFGSKCIYVEKKEVLKIYMIYKLFCEIVIHISSLGFNSYLRVICEMSRRVNIIFISQLKTLKFKVIKYNCCYLF